MSLRSNGYLSDGDARLLEKSRGKMPLRAEDCPTRTKPGTCRCGPCATCGFGPHMAIHLPTTNGLPFGHHYRRRL